MLKFSETDWTLIPELCVLQSSAFSSRIQVNIPQKASRSFKKTFYLHILVKQGGFIVKFPYMLTMYFG
jgi:hypothetical protein